MLCDVCRFQKWLGRQDSNLGMPVPKTGALPLGDAPTGQMGKAPLPEPGLISKAQWQRQSLS